MRGHSVDPCHADRQQPESGSSMRSLSRYRINSMVVWMGNKNIMHVKLSHHVTGTERQPIPTLSVECCIASTSKPLQAFLGFLEKHRLQCMGGSTSLTAQSALWGVEVNGLEQIE